MKRTRRAQVYSRLPARYLHLPDGKGAERRNARIQRLAEDIAWIHDYDVEEALAAEGALSDRAESAG